jgi:hypothetical protein
MRKLFTAIATVTLLLAGSLIWKAEAAMTTGVGGLAPVSKNHTSENVGYYYRRGWRRPHYGYGYRPYYGYGWRRPYYGYGYRPYYGYGWRRPYYGRRWRY